MMAIYLPPGAVPAFPTPAGEFASVNVSSPAAMAASVAAWAGAKTWAIAPAKAPVGLAAEFPAGKVALRGADLLLEVGSATTPAGAQSPLGPAHWWPLLRYYWAFDRTAAGQMCLSPGANELRYHHRQAISEYLGVGVALRLVRHLLGGRYPGAPVAVIDAEQALSYPGALPGVAALGDLRPDYFVTVLGGPVFVVECKGATSGAGRRLSLAKAMRQLRSVTYQGVAPAGFAVHTAINADGFDAVIFDPDGDDVWARPPALASERRVSGRAGEHGPVITDVPSFRGELDDLSQSALLWWSGAEAAGLALMPQRVREALRVRPGEDGEVVSVQVGDRTFEGVQAAIPIGGRTLFFFRGLAQPLRRLLLAKAAGQVDEAEVDAARIALTDLSNVAGPPERVDAGSAEPVDEVVAVSQSGAASRLALGQT